MFQKGICAHAALSVGFYTFVQFRESVLNQARRSREQMRIEFWIFGTWSSVLADQRSIRMRFRLSVPSLIFNQWLSRLFFDDISLKILIVRDVADNSCLNVSSRLLWQFN